MVDVADRQIAVQSGVVAARRMTDRNAGNAGRINIRDVARKAGVSIGTVSLAINNRPGVSKKTRDEVLKIVQEMGYVPSLIGRAINRCRAGVIGVLMPVAHSPLFAQVVAGINDEAEDDRGMPIFVSFSQDRSAIESRMLRIFSQLRIDGLLLASVPETENTQLISELFGENQVPIVQVERMVEGLDADFVGSDNREAAYRQTLRLLDTGHESVGFVMTTHRMTAAEERYLGWQSALQSRGIAPEASWTRYLDTAEAPDAQKALMDILEDESFPKTMLWCAGGTAVVPRTLNRMGRINGEGIEVVLFDADPRTDFAGQRFTHIEQDGYRIGRAATELLLDRADHLAEGHPMAEGRAERRFKCLVCENDPG